MYDFSPFWNTQMNQCANTREKKDTHLIHFYYFKNISMIKSDSASIITFVCLNYKSYWLSHKGADVGWDDTVICKTTLPNSSLLGWVSPFVKKQSHVVFCLWILLFWAQSLKIQQLCQQNLYSVTTTTINSLKSVMKLGSFIFIVTTIISSASKFLIDVILVVCLG